jgi:hypothetical protein
MTVANLNPDSDKPKVMICPPGEAHVDAPARIGELFRKARIGDRNGAEVLGSIEGDVTEMNRSSVTTRRTPMPISERFSRFRKRRKINTTFSSFS